MKITISKNQLNLLTKRNAVAEAANVEARTTETIAKMSADKANHLREAFADIVSTISADANQEPAEYAGVKFGEEDGKCFLDLIEKPKA